MNITYTTGDATRPHGDGPKIIAHIVNDEGKWGSGFVVALSQRNMSPEKAYRAWSRRDDEYLRYIPPINFLQGQFMLGGIQLVKYTGPDVLVANMVAQRGVRHDSSAPRAVQYGSLESCLARVAEEAERLGASVHMPRIGCGLGGGSWDEIEPIIQNTLIARGVPVTVYDLESA